MNFSSGYPCPFYIRYWCCFGLLDGVDFLLMFLFLLGWCHGRYRARKEIVSLFVCEVVSFLKNYNVWSHESALRKRLEYRTHTALFFQISRERKTVISASSHEFKFSCALHVSGRMISLQAVDETFFTHLNDINCADVHRLRSWVTRR